MMQIGKFRNPGLALGVVVSYEIILIDPFAGVLALGSENLGTGNLGKIIWGTKSGEMRPVKDTGNI